eukprot:Pgem_evm1s14681
MVAQDVDDLEYKLKNIQIKKGYDVHWENSSEDQEEEICGKTYAVNDKNLDNCLFNNDDHTDYYSNISSCKSRDQSVFKANDHDQEEKKHGKTYAVNDNTVDNCLFDTGDHVNYYSNISTSTSHDQSMVHTDSHEK